NKDINNISKDIMWKATVLCDSAYDGIFFYAVKTTGVFCRPSCKSRVTNSDNVSFFSNAAEAQKAEYRPCKQSLPDLKLMNPYFISLRRRNRQDSVLIIVDDSIIKY